MLQCSKNSILLLLYLLTLIIACYFNYICYDLVISFDIHSNDILMK